MASMAKDKKRKPAKFARWRVWVQLLFLLVWVNPLLEMHNLCGPVFHCYSCPWSTFACPIGILANSCALHTTVYQAIGVLVASGAVFGAFICGWACPFGFLQDLIAKIPTPKFTLPLWMGSFRYVVLLAFVLVIPFLWGESHPLFICRLCPAGAIGGALPNVAKEAISRQMQNGTQEQRGDASAKTDPAEAAAKPLPWPGPLKMAIVVMLLIAMFFTWRPWCTLFCPLGAIYGVLNYVSFLFLRFHKDRCIDCADCRSLCVDGAPAERRVDGLHCVRCADCTRCRAVTVETVFSPSRNATPVDISPPKE
jgi:ferredoxin-type protein NapH